MDLFEFKKCKWPSEWNNSNVRDELKQFLQKNWELRKVFYDDNCNDTDQRFLEFYDNEIKPRNYIGVICFNDVCLNIYPKIFKRFYDDNTGKIDSHKLNSSLEINLNEWVKYCDFNPPYINAKSDFENIDSLKDLFIVIFIGYLENILNKSGYFQYEEKTEDLQYITGKFNVQDYICNKYPSGNLTKFKCTYSSFEFDNLLNRIIKYVCKLLISETKNNQVKIRLYKINAKLSDVSDCKYTSYDCDKVKIDKMHRDYQIILLMCKMFLLNKTLSFTNPKNNSYCFLFPMEKLFEGFIGGFIKNNFPSVELQETDKKHLIDCIEVNGKEINNSSVFSTKPDILYKVNNQTYILDTKYKEIDYLTNNGTENLKQTVKEGVKQADLYQMVAYALKWNTSHVCLIYPQFLGEKIESVRPTLKFNYGDNKEINIQIARVPFAVDSENDIADMELNLKRIISDILEVNK